MTPRVSSLRADSGPSVLPSGRAAHTPLADRVTSATSLTVGTTPAASAVGGFSYGLARFFDTLGIADDPVWKPAHEGQEPPF